MRGLLATASAAIILLAAVSAAAEMPMTPSYPSGLPTGNVEPPAAPQTAGTAEQRTRHAEPAAPPHHAARATHRRYARLHRRPGWSGDHVASRLNRAELYGGAIGAFPAAGIGPAPYSSNGP